MNAAANWKVTSVQPSDRIDWRVLVAYPRVYMPKVHDDNLYQFAKLRGIRVRTKPQRLEVSGDKWHSFLRGVWATMGGKELWNMTPERCPLNCYNFGLMAGRYLWFYYRMDCERCILEAALSYDRLKRFWPLFLEDAEEISDDDHWAGMAQ